jgi:hypothetical protein
MTNSPAYFYQLLTSGQGKRDEVPCVPPIAGNIGLLRSGITAFITRFTDKEGAHYRPNGEMGWDDQGRPLFKPYPFDETQCDLIATLDLEAALKKLNEPSLETTLALCGATGADLIREERHRQIRRGHSTRDNQEGDLALQEAAGAFLTLALSFRFLEVAERAIAASIRAEAIRRWPGHWGTRSLESTETRKEALIKAGAMIAAQLDQIADHAALANGEPPNAPL